MSINLVFPISGGFPGGFVAESMDICVFSNRKPRVNVFNTAGRFKKVEDGQIEAEIQ